MFQFDQNLNFKQSSSIKVFFDGDQSLKKEFKAICKKIEYVSYEWITLQKSLPNFLKKTDAELKISHPFGVGKESTDMIIAMLAMKECCLNSHLTEVVIVSSDGDMIEVLLILSGQFPDIKFFQMSPIGTSTGKKALDAIKKLPENVSFLRFRPK